MKIVEEGNKYLKRFWPKLAYITKTEIINNIIISDEGGAKEEGKKEEDKEEKEESNGKEGGEL